MGDTPTLADLQLRPLAGRHTEARHSQLLLQEGWGRQLPQQARTAPT